VVHSFSKFTHCLDEFINILDDKDTISDEEFTLRFVSVVLGSTVKEAERYIILRELQSRDPSYSAQSKKDETELWRKLRYSTKVQAFFASRERIVLRVLELVVVQVLKQDAVEKFIHNVGTKFVRSYRCSRFEEWSDDDASSSGDDGPSTYFGVSAALCKHRSRAVGCDRPIPDLLLRIAEVLTTSVRMTASVCQHRLRD